MAYKQKAKSPIAKALVGNQHKLPRPLQDAIKAAPESSAKMYGDSPAKQTRTRIGRRGPKAEGAGSLIGQVGGGRRGQASGVGAAVGQITQPYEVRRIPHAMTELPAKTPSVPTPKGAELKPVAKPEKPEAKSKKQKRKEKRADKLEAKAKKLRG